MPFRRWKPRFRRMSPFRRRSPAEVSNISFVSSVSMQGAVTYTSPQVTSTLLLSEGSLLQSATSHSPDVRGVSLLGLNFSLWVALTSEPVSEVIAISPVHAALYIDAIDNTSPTVGYYLPNYHYSPIVPYGTTHDEFSLPKRTLWREENVIYVGTTVNGEWFSPRSFCVHRHIRKRAFLSDREGLFLAVSSSNATTENVTVAFGFNAACSWKSRR